MYPSTLSIPSEKEKVAPILDATHVYLLLELVTYVADFFACCVNDMRYTLE